MQLKSILATAFLAASASAYEVLTPLANCTLTKGKETLIRWNSVETDAEYFSVALVNFQTHHWPPTVVILAQDVHRDAGAISLRIPCKDITSDYGWQINFINGTNTYVIYAQSKPFFSLTGDCSVDPPQDKPTIPAAPYPTGYYGNNTGPHTTTITRTVCTTYSTITLPASVIYGPINPHTPGAPGAPGAPSGPGGPGACPPGPVTVTITKTAGHEGPGGYPVTKTPGPSAPGYAVPTGAVKPKAPLDLPTGAASGLRVSGAAGLIVAAIAFML